MPISKIDDAKLFGDGVFHINNPDVPMLDAKEMKEFMDYVPRKVLIPKVNEVIDRANGSALADDVYTRQTVDEKLSEKANADSVYTKTESDNIALQKADKQDTYTKAEVDSGFCNALINTVMGKEVTIDDLSPACKTVNVNLVSKNIMPFEAEETTTMRGVTFTRGADGKVTVSGKSTSTANIIYYLSSLVEFEAGTYYLSGCPETGSSSSYWMVAVNSDGVNYSIYKTDTGSGVAIVLDKPDKLKFSIRIAAGYDMGEGITFSPMLERGDTKTEYTAPVKDFRGFMLGAEIMYEDGSGMDAVTQCESIDGIITGLDFENCASVTIDSQNSRAIVRCEYSRDINAVIKEILNKISKG